MGILVCFLLAGFGPLIAEGAEFRFSDVTEQAGVAFRNWYGNNSALTILETTGSGAAFCDFDDDGDLDLYIVNGDVGFDSPRFRDLPRDVRPPAEGEPLRNALFRNEGDGTFSDVTEAAGTGHTGWGGGCACGDYDNDGDRDLFIAYYGPNVLYRNEGDGTFVDVSAAAGVDDGGYGTACAFADSDRDGDLDLFVGNYVDFDPETTILPGERRDNYFGAMRGIPTVASPEGFAGQPDILYRNEGDGTFVDVSAQVGLNPVLGKTLGAVFWDYDNDGDSDLYVANDATPNFLYTNRGDGTFSEDGLVLGVSHGADGVLEGSMGVAAGDVDNDGWQDIVVSNYEAQTATLHHNQGGIFANISVAAGLARTTLMPMQWGTILFDGDLDGDLDLFIANGHVTAALEDYYPQSSFAQRNQLFRNDGGKFADVTLRAGAGLRLVKSSRGTASGDYDGDGDEDLFVVNKNDIPSLLRNDTVSDNHWLMVRTRGRASNRDGIGAKVRVVGGGRSQVREVSAGSSYLSHNSLELLFGLGMHRMVDTLEVRWPGGTVDRIVALEGDCAVTVVEGQGLEVAP